MSDSWEPPSSQDWNQFEYDQWEHFRELDPGVAEDGIAASLYHDAFFENHAGNPEYYDEARETLERYMWETYGIDFYDEFDWDAYGDWYDAQ